MLNIITNKSDYQFSPALATDTVSHDLPLMLFQAVVHYGRLLDEAHPSKEYRPLQRCLPIHISERTKNCS